MAFTSDRGMGCTAYMVRSASNTLHQVGYRRITGGLQVGDRRFTGGLQVGYRLQQMGYRRSASNTMLQQVCY